MNRKFLIGPVGDTHFFLLVLLRFNLQIGLYKFKVYSIVI